MKRWMFPVMTAFAVAFALWADAQSVDGNKVTILFTNDAHTHVDNTPEQGLRYSQVAKLKEDCAQDGPVFLADAGDYLQGTAFGVFDSGKSIIDLMNAAGYDVATVGNHEFDFHATNILARAEQADFPIVSCSVWRKNSQFGEEVRALASYAVLTNGGVSIAFVGLTTPDTIPSESPRCFLDPTGSWQAWGIYGYPASDVYDFFDSIQNAVDEAQSWSPDYVVLLGHAGMSDDLFPYRSYDIIANTYGYDCFIDGHSHTENAGEVITNSVGKPVLVAQTGSALSSVGRIVLSKDAAPRSELVKSVDGKVPAVVQLEERLIEDVVARLSEELAQLDFDMPAKNAADGSWLVRSHATAIGDFESDAFYWYANSKGDAAHAADVAIVHGGGIRDGLRVGTLTLKDAMAVNPFQNEMLVSEMSGATLLDALEWGVRNAPSAGNAELLHVAGLRYSAATNFPSPVVVDTAFGDIWCGVTPGATRRVRDVTVYDRADGTWKPLDPEKTYRVASMDFLLRSCGNGYSMMTNAVPVGFYSGSELDVSQFAAYMKSFADGRIATANSPLFERGYRDALAYGEPCGGGRIRFTAAAVDVTLGAGSDQCLSEPTDLVRNAPAGAVSPWTDINLQCLPELEDDEFTYAVFGDTQNYYTHANGDFTNESFTARVDWLIANKDSQKIRFVSHLGDVVDNPNSASQWTFASNQIARLVAAQIPFAIAPGNHDVVWGDATLFSDNLPHGGDAIVRYVFKGFSGLRYSEEKNIRNRYSDREADDVTQIPDVAGRGANTCQLLDVEGDNFVLFHLQCSTPKPVLDWVDDKLAEYGNRLAIIVTHEGLGHVNAKMPFEREQDRINIGRMRCARITSNDSRSAQYQWERCYSRHPNVLMVLSGHQIEALSHIRTGRGRYGNDVVEIVQNYPETPLSDWIRLYRINPVKRTIRALTWSPGQQKLCEGNEPDFDIATNGKGENYLYATNCPHQFTVDYGKLRDATVGTPSGSYLETATDKPLADGSFVNGRQLFLAGTSWSGVATYPIVRRVEVARNGTDIVIRYNLLNDYEVGGKGGTIRVLSVVTPRVLLAQDGQSVEVTDLLSGDTKVGRGGWCQVRLPMSAAAGRLGISTGDITNMVATVATVPQGTAENPWNLGEGVTACLEGGTLYVSGAGAMPDYSSASDAPWSVAASCIGRVEVEPTVTHIGTHAFDGISSGVPLALTETQTPRLAGAISPAEFTGIDIVDGKALLGVAVYTSETLTNEVWSCATNSVIEVPASGKSGFYILKSK